MPKADRAPSASRRQELGAEDIRLIWPPASHCLYGSLARTEGAGRCPCHELGSSSRFKRRGRVWAVPSCLFQSEQREAGGRGGGTHGRKCWQIYVSAVAHLIRCCQRFNEIYFVFSGAGHCARGGGSAAACCVDPEPVTTYLWASLFLSGHSSCCLPLPSSCFLLCLALSVPHFCLSFPVRPPVSHPPVLLSPHPPTTTGM